MSKEPSHSVASQRQAVRAIERGETWRSVAERWGVSTGLLTRWRRWYGTKPTKPTVIRDASEQYFTARFKRQAMRWLLIDKVPMMTLSEKIGVTDTTLRAWRRKFAKRKHPTCPCCRCYTIK